MAGGKQVVVLVVAAVVLVSLQGGWANGAEEVHHVVGGDRGWDPKSDLASWASGRSFSVGDKIWFRYSVAEGIVLELKTKEEYESCDVTNPISMFTDGLDSTKLDGVGIRYFASSNIDNCKGGLKIHVEVAPDDHPGDVAASELAAGPTPSASFQLGANWALLVAALWVIFMGF